MQFAKPWTLARSLMLVTGLLMTAFPLAAVTTINGVATKVSDRSIRLSQLSVKFTLDQAFCDTVLACGPLWELQDWSTTPGRPVPAIKEVSRGDRDSLTELMVTLDADLPDTKDFAIVARRLNARVDTAGTIKDVRGVFPFASQLKMSGGGHNRLRIALDQPIATPSASGVTLKGIDVATEDEIPMRIQSIDAGPDCTPTRCEVFIVHLADPLPLGKTILVSYEVTGALSGSAKLTMPGYPKSRDEADVYVSGQAQLAQGGKDSYAADIKYVQPIFPSRAAAPENGLIFGGLRGILDIHAGSDALELPDYGSLSAPFRWQYRRDFRTRWTVDLGPEFRTDKKLDNRDLGLTLLWIPKSSVFDRSLATRRASDPKAKWGRSMAFGLGTEAGWHLASVSEEVEGEMFARALGKVDFVLEYDEWKLSTSVQLRHLFRDELSLEGEDVVGSSGGFRAFVRTELSRDVGFMTLSVVNTAGRVPAGFKRARSTVIGVTFKR